MIIGCEPDQKARWDSDIVLPLAQANLSINDFEGENYQIENSDGALRFVYSYEFGNLTTDTLFQVPDTTITKTVSLKSLKLGTKKVQQVYTLGQVAKNAGSKGNLIIVNDGNKSTIPPIQNIAPPEENINATNLFERAEVKNGKLVLNIDNGFPVELTDVSFIIKNQNSGSTVIKEDGIPSIPAQSSKKKIYEIKDQKVEGNLTVDILNINTPGSKGASVKIDTSDQLLITIKTKDFNVVSAKAIFPAQDLVTDTANVKYNMGGPELKDMRVAEGFIGITTNHTIPDSLYLTYDIPKAKLNGVEPLHVERPVPPAPPNGAIEKEAQYDITDYHVNLRAENDTFNTFKTLLRLSIDSTGKKVDISLNDSIFITYGLYDIKPAFAQGYLGEYDFNLGPDSINIDAFKEFQADKITLDDVSLRLTTENGFGIGGNVNITQLKAINKSRNNSIALSSSAPSSLKVKPAYKTVQMFDFAPKFNNLPYSPNNSNIKEMIEIIPDALAYKMALSLNKSDAFKKTYTDFVFDDSYFNGRAEIQFPLNFSVENFQISDTSNFEFEKIKDVNQINNAFFRVVALNGYPLKAKLQAYFIDGEGKTIDSLFAKGPSLIMPGKKDSKNDRFVVEKKTKLKEEMSQSKLKRLQEAEQVYLKSLFSTSPPNENFKFYSDYNIDLKLIGNFSYQTQL